LGGGGGGGAGLGVSNSLIRFSSSNISLSLDILHHFLLLRQKPKVAYLTLTGIFAVSSIKSKTDLALFGRSSTHKNLAEIGASAT